MVTIPKPGMKSTHLFWNESSGAQKVYAEGRCRMCQRPNRVRPLTRHHLVPLRWFLSGGGQHLRMVRNANANIIPLCRPCHDLVEQDQDARRMLRKLLTQQEIAFAVRTIGLRWFNHRYPQSEDSLPGYEHCD